MASLYCSTSYYWAEWSKFLSVHLEITQKYPNFIIFLVIEMYCCKQACSDACIIERGWCTQLSIYMPAWISTSINNMCLISITLQVNTQGDYRLFHHHFSQCILPEHLS